jgi:hypothetical protein
MNMDFFDATQVQPSQGGDKHPAGMFNFTITNTYAKSTKDQSGGMFVVEFTSEAGRIESRYNLWNQSAQAVEIAQKQLSALCHATGIFKISFPKNPDGSPNMQMAGAELRNGRGRMEVAPQKNNPEYTEVKRVFDINGNEPGKSGGTPQPQQQAQGWDNQAPQGAPMQQQPSGGWSAPANNAPPNNAQNPPAWGNAQPQQQQQAPQPKAAPGWQQAPQQGTPQPQNPPWARG